MTPIPGLLVLWSGTVARSGIVRVPPDGLELGREHADPSDDRISRRHLQVWIRDRKLIAIDGGSRNGSFVGGRRVEGPGVQALLPAVIRIGRTVAVAVPDVRPYEQLVEDGGDGPVLESARRQLDGAALAEENVTIEGPRALAMELAQRYADTVGGSRLVFDAEARPSLDQVLTGERPRTVLLVLLDHALSQSDMPTIETWLETDVRFVTVMTAGSMPLSLLDASAVESLRRRVVEVWPPFEMLPAAVHAVLHEIAPQATLHASAIEAVAIGLCKLELATALASVRGAILRWQTTGRTIFRGADVHGDLFPANPMHCVIGRAR